MAVYQNLVPLVNIKIAGKWMFIPLKMLLIGIDPYPSRVTSQQVLMTSGQNSGVEAKSLAAAGSINAGTCDSGLAQIWILKCLQR